MNHRRLLAVCAAFLLIPITVPEHQAAGQESARTKFHRGCAFPGQTSSIQVQNTGKKDASVTIVYVSSDGTQTSTETAKVNGPGSKVFETPGFAGSAVIKSDMPVVGVVNQINSGGDKKANPSTCAKPVGISGLSGPVDKKSSFTVQNVGDSKVTVTPSLVDKNGKSLGTGKDIPLEPDQGRTFELDEIFGNVPDKSKVIPFSSSTSSFTAFTNVNNAQVPVTDADSTERTRVIPLPRRMDSGFTTSYTIQNTTTTPQDVTIMFRDKDGNVLTQQTAGLESEGSFSGSITTTSDNPIVAMTTLGPQPNSATAQYDGLENRARVGEAAAWVGLGASSAIAKKGYAFGAQRDSTNTSITLVVFNTGGKTAKVKVRVIDGDTGKKLQSGKVNVPSGLAMGELAFKKKAVGDNMFVELTVKGGTTVVAWLMRDADGDVDFYPAVPRQ